MRDPVVAAYIITGLLVVFFALLLIELEGTSFLHWGPGTTPENTTTFLGLKVNNWKRWSLVMAASVLYTLLLQWRVQICKNFRTLEIKPRKIDYATFCSPYGSRCHETVLAFVTLDSFNACILGILPILLFTTKQLQFMLPAIVISTVASTTGTMHQFSKKDGYPS